MHKKETVFETPWFSVEAESDDAGLHNTSKPFYRINVPDSVVVVALTKENKIVLVRQFRPAIQQYTLELPAGCIDENEKPEIAAAREMYEESGYRCDSLQFVNIGGGAVDRLNTKVYIYFGQEARQDPNFIPEPGIEVMTATLPDFIKMILEMKYLNYPVLGALILTKWTLNPVGLDLTP